MRHDVSQGFLQKVGHNYFMWLSVDGEKRRRRTGTDDVERATEMLTGWRRSAYSTGCQTRRIR
jgi:hypothetical protein